MKNKLKWFLASLIVWIENITGIADRKAKKFLEEVKNER